MKQKYLKDRTACDKSSRKGVGKEGPDTSLIGDLSSCNTGGGMCVRLKSFSTVMIQKVKLISHRVNLLSEVVVETCHSDEPQSLKTV